MSALAALAAGGLVVAAPKATRLHRRAGWTYVAAMGVLNGTALMIYDLFGGFGPFHVAALLSGVTLVGGLVPALRRRRGWIARHANWMAWSYVGLLAAAASETATRWLHLGFGTTVLVATAAVVVGGALVIRARLPRTLAPFEP